jgi:hypothetical protein
MSYKIIDTDGKIISLEVAKSIAHKFMTKNFNGYKDSDISISFFKGDNGYNKTKIKIKSKELSRDIILEGMLKDGSIR